MLVLEQVWDVVSEVPGELTQWGMSLNDGSFVRIMFVGAVLLTFVIARALR
jgi:hypothetical protein